MSELSISLLWQLNSGELSPGKYSNKHEIIYNDDFKVIGDAAPSWKGNPDYTNPEQALAAALSSCHMMTFLALAAKAKWPVCAYQDTAIAHLGKNSEGKMSINKIDLHPKVTFAADFNVSAKEMAEMQERAHRYCFVASSLSKEVDVNIH